MDILWLLTDRYRSASMGGMTSLKGKRALVTSGSRGIGAAIVRQFLDSGADVVTTARTATDETPDGARFIEADVRTRAGVSALAESAVDILGGVDILVNNAGAGRVHLTGPAGIPDEDWQDSLDINFLSSVRLDSLLLPQMRERRSGAIVHISTAAVLTPAGPMLHYVSAKAALDTYSRGLALAAASDGVRVNIVAPGNVSTPGANFFRSHFGDPAPDTAPLGRIGQPDDVAGMVSFLVSDQAAWITGRWFIVDGGEFPAA
jgi:NAD(P)-dependent dehydrogenase (short-subunit alcohol dehydrogenase family)